MIIIGNWTINGYPQTGLTPQIKIVNAVTDTLILTDTMNELIQIPGSYIYDFTTYNPSIQYLIQCDSQSNDSDSRYLYATGNNELDIAKTVWNKINETYPNNTMGALLNAINEAEQIIEPNYNLKETLRIILAILAGKAYGGGTLNVGFRDINDTKDRVQAIVDENGNRLSITIDKS